MRFAERERVYYIVCFTIKSPTKFWPARAADDCIISFIYYCYCYVPIYRPSSLYYYIYNTRYAIILLRGFRDRRAARRCRRLVSSSRPNRCVAAQQRSSPILSVLVCIVWYNTIYRTRATGISNDCDTMIYVAHSLGLKSIYNII